MSLFFFFSSRRRHTRLTCDWSSDVCSSDLAQPCLQPRARALDPSDRKAEEDGEAGERTEDEQLSCGHAWLGLLLRFVRRTLQAVALYSKSDGRAPLSRRVPGDDLLPRVSDRRVQPGEPLLPHARVPPRRHA